MAKSRKYGRKMRSTRKKYRKSRRRGGCGCKRRGGNAQIDKGISDWVSDPVYHQ